MSQQPIRLMIAEDQSVVRKAIAALLAMETDIDIVATAADGEQAVSAARAYSPDIVLMDVKMPRMDGVAATRAIVSENPDVRVIMLTTFDADELVFDAILAGAQSYLLKDSEESEILATIRAVAKGEPRLSPNIAAKILGEFRRVKAPSQKSDATRLEEEKLTDREKDILAGVAAGKGNRQIAQELGLAEGTVKNHVSTILAKLHLRSRTELAIKALSQR
ncbi:MAG: response regulator transcription factor [Methylocystis sp.]|nr:response regulator transcription factor [Methylocystis sp.]